MVTLLEEMGARVCVLVLAVLTCTTRRREHVARKLMASIAVNEMDVETANGETSRCLIRYVRPCA